MSLCIAPTSTSRFLGGNKVHFDGNNAHGEGISNANEELPGRWTKIGLIKAKRSCYEIFVPIVQWKNKIKLVECSPMVIACSAY